MAKLQIVSFPDPVLRRRTSPVPLDEPGLAALVGEMFEAMYDAEGVGLAANQVGLGKRLAVIDCSAGRDEREKLVLINPELLWIDGEAEEQEGCLSLPGLRAKPKRGARARVKAWGLDGKPFEVEGEGLLGKALQHELDHLDGKLFIDRLSLAQQALVSGQLKAFKQRAKDLRR